jgi:hypothetical protein
MKAVVASTNYNNFDPLTTADPYETITLRISKLARSASWPPHQT